MNLAQADQITTELVETLRPACEPGYIVSAGSVRRRKPEPKDVEFVFVSKTVKQQVDLFTYADVPVTDGVIARLVAQNILIMSGRARRKRWKTRQQI
jgi:DNA polymerase/3'-5' exonuclease PolX